MPSSFGKNPCKYEQKCHFSYPCYDAYYVVLATAVEARHGKALIATAC